MDTILRVEEYPHDIAGTRIGYIAGLRCGTGGRHLEDLGRSRVQPQRKHLSRPLWLVFGIPSLWTGKVESERGIRHRALKRMTSIRRWLGYLC